MSNEAKPVLPVVAHFCEYLSGEEFVSLAVAPMNDPDVQLARPLVFLFDAESTIATERAAREAAEQQAEALRAALLDCARKAEALKRECGMDPESPQAVRNGQYMAISVAAHVALGTIRGASPQPLAPVVPLTESQLLAEFKRLQAFDDERLVMDFPDFAAGARFAERHHTTQQDAPAHGEGGAT